MLNAHVEGSKGHVEGLKREKENCNSDVEILNGQLEKLTDSYVTEAHKLNDVIKSSQDEVEMLKTTVEGFFFWLKDL